MSIGLEQERTLDAQGSIERCLDCIAVAVSMTWFILAGIALAGINGELNRDKSRVGTPRARTWFTVFSVAMILFTLGYSALCFWDSQINTPQYFFVLLGFGIRMAPAVILALVQIRLHLRPTEDQHGATTG